MIDLIFNIIKLYAVYFATVFIIFAIWAWSKRNEPMEDKDYELQD